MIKRVMVILLAVLLAACGGALATTQPNKSATSTTVDRTASGPPTATPMTESEIATARYISNQNEIATAVFVARQTFTEIDAESTRNAVKSRATTTLLTSTAQVAVIASQTAAVAYFATDRANGQIYGRTYAQLNRAANEKCNFDELSDPRDPIKHDDPSCYDGVLRGLVTQAAAKGTFIPVPSSFLPAQPAAGTPNPNIPTPISDERP